MLAAMDRINRSFQELTGQTKKATLDLARIMAQAGLDGHIIQEETDPFE